MTDWLVIAGDFTPLGGMDRANHALAAGLAARGDRVRLVTHRAWADLSPGRAIEVQSVPRPLGSHLLGAPLLARAGERAAVACRGAARVVANGGNADGGDVNWVHYVHAAHPPVAGGWRRALQGRAAHAYYLARERRALRRSRVVICNSQRTARDVRDRVGVDDGARIEVVYYGSDSTQLAAVTDAGRARARQELGWPAERPVAIFVGALGDRRKGFDRLFAAWDALSRRSDWDVDLAVVGGGSELPAWRRRADRTRLSSAIRFLGFRNDVPRLLAASDLLVHPARYEAYGLGVHEAICRGLPAIVSAEAGIAELYPADLRDWLIDDVEDVSDLVERLRRWRSEGEAPRRRVRPFSDRLRARTWADMVEEFAGAAR